MSPTLESEIWYNGIVGHGLHNGERFGFPTANVFLHESIELDKGVYAVRVCVDGQALKGMLYVGTRPTLNLNDITLEINIFDFNEDIYGKEIMFSIVQKIRSEQKFSSINELIQQLERDKVSAQQLLD